MSKSGASGEVITLPKGGGALHGIGEKFSPDLHTGTGNFTVPIALPPGRNGFQPQLNLCYSTGSGNGPLGLGWSVSIPGVSRKTSKGIPRYDDVRDTFILSGAEDLVPVPGAPAGATRYRPRTEGLFARIEHHYAAGQNYWKMRSKDGLESVYGSPDLLDANAAVVADPGDRSRIFAWKLTRTIDPFGNRIEYTYERDAVQTNGPHHWDQLRLSEIRYIDHGDTANPQFLVTVRFTYDDRPDPFSDYRVGFEVRTVRRCATIEIFTHEQPNTLARSYRFTYLDQRDLRAEQRPLNGVSLLSQIEVVGHDGDQTEELPPLTFNYTRFEPERRAFLPLAGNDLPARSLAHPELELADLFGNGLPDILEMNGTVRYWRNLGGGRFDMPREMRTAPAGLRLGDRGVQLIDANGDGRMDLLVTTNSLAGYYPLQFGGLWDRRSFQRYRVAPSFDLKDPEVRMVDLDGDGITDAIRSGDRLECFFNDPEEGWHDTRQVERRALEAFPNISFTDPRVKWADITGDGMQDIVLVFDGNVEYWPALGRGGWGPRVHMRYSPALPFGYDPKRILLGDVDGDGLADMVYVDDTKVTLWINQSGNSWSDPITIHGTPPVSDMDAVRLTDFLGNGVSGVLWSADATGRARDHLFFLDFTGGVKPYLLNEMDDHMGATTRVAYVPSTRFYLEDEKRPETRWKTPLPFPVQVVSNVEVIDDISHGKLTTEYRYHHGYWDGAEREFRGFGRVDHRDTEVFDEFHASGLHSERRFDAVPVRAFSPPTETRTWFHQGPIGEEFRDWYETDFGAEFWSGDPAMLDRPPAMVAALKALSRRDRRDALRTLRGCILRTELYARDGTPQQDRPYTVTEHMHGAREESPPEAAEANRQRIFFPHTLAERTTQWERGEEPMVQLTYTGDYDAYGQPLSQVSIAVPRGRDARLTGVTGTPYLATQTLTRYAQRDDDQRYIVDRVARVTSYEIRNDGSLSLHALLASIDGLPAARQVIGQTDNFYDGVAFAGMPPGQIGEHGALVRTEILVITEEILREAYGSAPPPYLAIGVAPAWNGDYPPEFRTLVSPLAGYVFRPGSADPDDVRGYFAAADQRRYDIHDFGGKGRGLVMARRDPLGHETVVSYDRFELLPVAVADPAGLTTHADYDYRVLQLRELTGPNGNRTVDTFTPLGLLKSTAVSGKIGEGDQARPSTHFDYDFAAQPVFVRTIRHVHHDTEDNVPLPERDEAIETVEYSDGLGRVLQTRTQAEDVAFGDPVFGDAGLPADQSVSPGDAVGHARDLVGPPRVVVSGWQIYDNKGRVVEKYEPFFSSGWDYAPPTDEQFGQKVTMFYDPRGHVLRTVNPDGSEQRVIYGVPDDLDNPGQFTPTAWEAYTYDANDNAGRTHPADPKVRQYDYHWNTPSSAVVDALGRTVETVERNRTKLPDGSLSSIEEFRTTSTYDIRDNLLSVTDALGRVAFRYVYDLKPKGSEKDDGARVLRIEQLDGGIRRVVFDAAGNEIERRDSKGALTLHALDCLNRPIRLWARDGTGEPLTLRERLEYGDGGVPNQPPDERDANQLANRLGKLHRHYDEAGLLAFEAYDFKGNILEKVRQVIGDAPILSVFGLASNRQVAAFRVDWTPSSGTALDAHAAALLDATLYQTSPTYDALNRVETMRNPRDVDGERKMLRPHYNQAGALERVELDGALFVAHIAHNAKGQRTLIAYGNGMMTRYAYDPKTFHLLRLRTERYARPAPLVYHPAGPPLQDFAYDYDLHGNILALHDRAPESGVPNMRLGTDALDRVFTYDPLYRLLTATGRECDMPPAPPPWLDESRCADLTRTRPYTEQYHYDPIGNMAQLQHQASGGSFTRVFTLVPDSNRLATMTIGLTDFAYAYDANGNLAQETSSRHFEWDHSDRMRVYRTQPGDSEPSVHAHYLYDAGGQRVKKLLRKQCGQMEVTVYVDGVFEHHRLVQGSGTRENNTLHIMDNHSRIALVRVGDAFPGDATPALKYHPGDHLSSSSVVIDGDGALVNREEYTPYGETSFGSFARKRYRFTGRERDEESGLYYHGARYYAPWLGRWANCDPAGTVDGTHLYCYARNNPLGYVDPDGTQAANVTKLDYTDMDVAAHPDAHMVRGEVRSATLPLTQNNPSLSDSPPGQNRQTSFLDPGANSSSPPASSPVTDRKSNVGRNLVVSGMVGPLIRDAYAWAAKRMFGHNPTSVQQAQRMVYARGGERLVTRGATSALSLFSAWMSARLHWQRKEYGRAAFEALPAGVTVGMNATLFVRDRVVYGSFLGAIGNAEKRAQLVNRMMAGAQVAAKTSAVWTARFARIGKAMTWIGMMLEVVQMPSDNPAAVEWNKERERQAIRSGSYSCRSVAFGIVKVCY